MMTDAYTHLDLSAPDPLGDMATRMDSAGIDRALVVETWNGENQQWLERLVARPDPRFRVAFCFRPEAPGDAERLLNLSSVAGVRVKTGHLRNAAAFADQLEASGKLLIVHAEEGIARLIEELDRFLTKHPGVPVYVPHLCWPAVEGRRDPAWPGVLERLRRLPIVVGGISAISYFSRLPYPHDDVRAWAMEFLRAFPASCIVVGSDYPLLDKNAYAGYMALAANWVLGVYPDWSDLDALPA